VSAAVPPTYDVLSIGNAIVDVISHAPDEFLIRHDLNKDSMALVESEKADELYAAMGPTIETSGGSAANTAVGVALLGGRAAFLGKVRDDQMGHVFIHDIRAAGVDFDVPPATHGAPTGRSLIVVTPDAHRTMSTSLGIAGSITSNDIDPARVGDARITYCEGYLWDAEPTKAAIRKAMGITRDKGNKVALTLSDGFCVERHRRELVASSVDVLFANEAEIVSLYNVDHFDEALQFVRSECELAFLTRSASGAVVVRGNDVHVVSADPQGPVVDTTGAGDQFAAGVLYGLTLDCDLPTCARIGSRCAGEVISHLGPRPQRDLKELVAPILEH
jgi:sugar/nucleoside kinase (ribokinase family)